MLLRILRIYFSLLNHFEFTFQSLFKILETYHNNCYIVCRFLIYRQLQNYLNSCTTKLMQWTVFRSIPLSRWLPHCFQNLSIRQLIKDSITTQQYKIIRLLNLALLDIWICIQNKLVAPIFTSFSLYITKRSTHAKTARKNS